MIAATMWNNIVWTVQVWKIRSLFLVAIACRWNSTNNSSVVGLNPYMILLKYR